MSDLRPAADLLGQESVALPIVLGVLDRHQFDLPTICTGWSVRDVLGHCGAALSMVMSDDLHGFSASENEADVDARRAWSIDDVLSELYSAYRGASVEIHRAGGSLDGIGLGEWVHGGDIREAVSAPHPYTSDGADLAFELLIERSASHTTASGATSRRAVEASPILDIDVDGTRRRFGGLGDVSGWLATDLETFVRLCSGRKPDPARYTLDGAEPSELSLFA